MAVRLGVCAALLLSAAASVFAADGSPIWCYPRAPATDPPCPQPDQCCAVWGVCGTGTHYCKKGHCAGGACLGTPVTPSSTSADTPPPLAATQSSCGAVLDDTDLFGADVNNGVPGQSIEECCAACGSMAGCGAFTFDPQLGACYLKAASGWDSIEHAGLRSVVMEPSNTSLAGPPAPEPAASSCGAALQDVDLNGGDIAGGVAATTLEACCASCRAEPSCGAFTFLPQASICYLKYADGWTSKVGGGMLSVILTPSQLTSPPPYSQAPAAPKPSKPSPGGGYRYVDMTKDQMRRMYQLTSIFENADTNLQYAYAERLGDGRGVTYGFCGFTTGTSDGLEVVEKYTQIKPNNPLAKYLPALRALEGKGDKFTGLNGFDDAIKKLGNDQDFIKAQWDVCDTEYHEPAMQICRDIHCNYALTKAQLHDALVNHGQGLDDKFSVDYILMAAKKAVGGTPATGVDEAKWLGAFLTARYNLLYNWDRVARESVKRITMYEKLVDLGNFNLDGPIYIDLQKRKNANGEVVWQIKDVYYGTFLIYENPQDDRKLELIV